MAHIESPAAGERQPIIKRRARTKRVIRLLILTFAATMLIDAIVGDQGVVGLGRARRESDHSTEHLRRLQAENDLMRERNRRLREDRDALEEAARRDLGLMRPGEKVFIIRDLR